MKQCPACKTTYTDETLRFCLADGATLTDLGGEQQTVVRPGGDPMRVQIPQETQAFAVSPTIPQSYSGGSGGNGMKILLAVVGLAVLVIAALGVGAFIYFSAGRNEVAANNNSSNRTASPNPSPMSSPNSNQNDQRDQKIANLEKQLNEQKNANRSANANLTLPNQPTTKTTTARVNSPGDGFLALRTLPSSSAGARILQIPHGAMVSVGGCLGAARAGSGRWCRASYDGYSGWVFDSYLIY
jgi:hypothetical protein